MKKNILLLVLLFVSGLKAATFSVINTADAGAGSLRQAIIDANASGGADLIDIIVSGTLLLLSPLPTITEQVTIDGTGSNFIIDGNGNTSVGLQVASTAANTQILSINIDNISAPPSGSTATGIIANAANMVIDSVIITNIDGTSGTTGNPGQAGGDGIGIEINADGVSVSSANISSISGGNGGNGNVSPPLGNGGLGGDGIGIEINASDASVNSSTITTVSGGNGGFPSNSTGNGLNGGNGGNGYGISISAGSNYAIMSNIINDVNGGVGRNGDNGIFSGGDGGNGGNSSGILIATGVSSATIEDNDVSDSNGGNGGNGALGEDGGNAGNAGNGISIEIIGDMNTVILNTNLGSNSGGNGGNGGNAAPGETNGDGGNGGDSFGIKVTGSENLIQQNIVLANNTAGLGGPNGSGGSGGSDGTDGQVAGVLVDTGNENKITQNDITGNAAHFGIALQNNGNDNQVEPTMVMISICNGLFVGVVGQLNNNNASLGNRNYIIEFFNNAASSDPEQGRTFIGQVNVITDVSGNVSFFEEFTSVAPVAIGDFITATATLNNGSPINNTSPFSIPVQVEDGQSVDTKMITTNQNEAVTIILSGTSNMPQMFEIKQAPANGTLSAITSLTGPPNITAEVTYTPNEGFAGSDSFVYSFVDDECAALVSIAVLSGDQNRDLTPIIKNKYMQFCNLL